MAARKEEFSFHPNILLLRFLNEVLNPSINYNPKGRFGSKWTFWQHRDILAAKGHFSWHQERKVGVFHIVDVPGCSISESVHMYLKQY